jgi:hypothetical protein
VVDTASCGLARPDQRAQRQRVFCAKIAVARLNKSTSTCSRQFSRRNREGPSFSSVLRPTRLPVSISACRTLGRHRRPLQVEVPSCLAEGPIPPVAGLDDLSRELRGERAPGRDFLIAIIPNLDFLAGSAPHLVDVRQTGVTPRL